MFVMSHTLYREVIDLPELLPPPDSDGPVLQLADVDPERIVAAVAARQAAGGRLQEKVDGCWACAVVGTDGALGPVESRAGLRLRQGRRWAGRQLGARWAGWTIIGELEVGTTRARRAREDRNEGLDALDPWHVTELIDPAGRRIDGPELAMVVAQMAGLDLRGRLHPVREALPGESWADFARDVFDRGGEGVVLRTLDGHIYRAKPLIDFDRVVLGIVEHVDRRRHVRLQARLGLCTSAGKRPRYRETQVVELPARAPRLPRGTVVAVTGTSVNTESGVVRFARIVRVREDKPAHECRA